MICRTCGEDMVGDGVTRVIHCPGAECDDVEPDAAPVHCSLSLQEKLDQLTEAFERQGLQLQQTQKMLEQYKRQLSELESVVIKARNALTPRGMVKLSSEQQHEVRDQEQD